ncbi:Frataxin regulates mitochondrial iron accumulation [Fasciola gigantica]|uniref:ferroxidase n=1 Tax=Fasciola gigantica TaxID=46835 RepID=A0A504YPN5_FASGI|nr:Frataxin regulates mitochondrial iron accumulation [Fasciola gigantica]
MFGLIAISSRLVRCAFPAVRTVRFSCDAHDKSQPTENELSDAQYERLSTETLDKFAEVFDMLGEQYDLGDAYDVLHDYGVLKVEFGSPVGTYIINRQAPNKQLWLSSPLSGPKRYDFLINKGKWIYKHDGTALHNLLNKEISDIVGHSVEFPEK